MNDITQRLIEKIQSGDRLGTYSLYADWLSQDEKFSDGTIYNQSGCYLKQAIEVLGFALARTDDTKDLYEAIDTLTHYSRKIKEIKKE